MRKLDLNQDGTNEIPGKKITFNDTEYEILELQSENDEALEFPLRNLKSGLTRFVLKVFKVRPGSSGYLELLDGNRKTALFALEANELGIIREEWYESHGGLVRLCPYVSLEGNAPVHDPSDFPDLLEEAGALVDQQDYGRAGEIFNSILERNPHHTDALINQSVCFLGMQDPLSALGNLTRAIEIENNETTIYKNTALALTMAGRHKAAVATLEESLNRYEWDFAVLRMQSEIAAQYDVPCNALERIRRAVEMEPSADTEILRRMKSDLETSGKRMESYYRIHNAALRLMYNREWAAARDECKKAAAESSNNSVARLNANICAYHLGKKKKIAEGLFALLSEVDRDHTEACALLALLCNIAAGNLETATGTASYLASLGDAPMDLPGIPILAGDQHDFSLLMGEAPDSGGVMMEKSVENVIAMLRKFARESALSPEARETFAFLLDKYSQKEALMSED